MKTAIMILAVIISTSAFAKSQASSPDPSISGDTKSYSNTPDTESDPDAITCRPPQPLPDSRFMGPEICKTNAVWAQYHKAGMDLSADGTRLVPSEKWITTHPQACHPATMGGGGTIAMMQTNFSMLCE